MHTSKTVDIHIHVWYMRRVYVSDAISTISNGDIAAFMIVCEIFNRDFTRVPFPTHIHTYIDEIAELRLFTRCMHTFSTIIFVHNALTPLAGRQ